MVKYHKIIKISTLSSLVAANINYWLFYGGWTILVIPFITGALFILVQREDRAYKFLAKLAIGSFIFGFLAAFLTYALMYLVSNIFFNSDMPFWMFYNPGDYLMFSLAYVFMSFMGGLNGIILKGFYILYLDKKAEK